MQAAERPWKRVTQKRILDAFGDFIYIKKCGIAWGIYYKRDNSHICSAFDLGMLLDAFLRHLQRPLPDAEQEDK